MKHSASKRYQGQVVSVRLRKMSNQAVKMLTELSNEEIYRGSDRFIRQVDTPDECSLQVHQ